MTYVSDALRISERTRRAMREYDVGTTLEDVAFSTFLDLESMILREASRGTPVPPLQQRKLSVLLWWVHSICKNSGGSSTDPDDPNHPTAGAAVPTLTERMCDPIGTFCDHERTHHSSKQHKQKQQKQFTTTTAARDAASPSSTCSIIPSDWKEQFQRDLPALKRKLRDDGCYRDDEFADRFSPTAKGGGGMGRRIDSFMALQWLLCGIHNNSNNNNNNNNSNASDRSSSSHQYR